MDFEWYLLLRDKYELHFEWYLLLGDEYELILRFKHLLEIHQSGMFEPEF
jgi:hypothetical protein